MNEILNIQTTVLFILIYVILDSINILIRINDYKDNFSSLYVYPADTILFSYKLNEKFTKILLSFPSLRLIILIRLILAMLIIFLKPLSFLICIIFIIQLLIHLRNDVFFSIADRFVLTILLGISFYFNFFNSKDIQNYSLYFIGTISILSYFFTGYNKLKSKSWMKGIAIEQVLSTDFFGNEIYYSFLIKNKFISRLLNYTAIIFQLLAPLTIFSSKFAIGFFIVGFIFHFSIAVVMNLNNFFWVFVSTYPCIYILSLKVENYLWS
ncbi:hypothetical protein ACFSX9_13600 [Flavobacterium ardleyense]|uniref:HTTM domain-containing protein n=1 Tax=Flavobacterium ardleyense TaxID=2038737 RepID=A0ABW5ZDA9_9FLAO